MKDNIQRDLFTCTKDVNEIVFDATAHLKVPKNIGRRRKKLMMTQEKSTLAFQKLRLVNTKLDCVSIGLFHTLTRDVQILIYQYPKLSCIGIYDHPCL